MCLLITLALLLSQDRDTRRPPKTASRFPTWCCAPASLPPAGPNYGSNAHSYARTELAADTTAGIQGTVSWLIYLQVNLAGQLLLCKIISNLPKTYMLIYIRIIFTSQILFVGFSGAVIAAATNLATAKWHGPTWSQSFRWWSKHSTTRSAPKKAQGALATCRQPSEDLKCLYVVPFLTVLVIIEDVLTGMLVGFFSTLSLQ